MQLPNEEATDLLELICELLEASTAIQVDDFRDPEANTYSLIITFDTSVQPCTN